MARPKPDMAARRADLLEAAEALLRESGGRRLVLSEVAERVGISQSYAYRFFASKAALVEALADRWFAEVTAGVRAIGDSQSPPEVRLQDFVVAQMLLKTRRFDEDPRLFRAYLDLAEAHPKAVIQHLCQMETTLTQLMMAWLESLSPPRPELEQATAVFDDATRCFRDPFVIARRRKACTEERARLVVATVLRGLRGV